MRVTRLMLLGICFSLITLHSVTAEEVKMNELCQGPASSPVCAAKTWHACLSTQHKEFCHWVGVKLETIFELYTPPEKTITMGAEPWRNFEMPRNLKGVRMVTPERFRLKESGEAVDSRFMGTYEVMYEFKNCWFCDVMKESEFYRKEGDKFILTAWTTEDNQDLCLDEESENKVTECDYFISVDPWDQKGSMQTSQEMVQEALEKSPVSEGKLMDEFKRFWNKFWLVKPEA